MQIAGLWRFWIEWLTPLNGKSPRFKRADQPLGEEKGGAAAQGAKSKLRGYGNPCLAIFDVWGSGRNLLVGGEGKCQARSRASSRDIIPFHDGPRPRWKVKRRWHSADIDDGRAAAAAAAAIVASVERSGTPGVPRRLRDCQGMPCRIQGMEERAHQRLRQRRAEETWWLIGSHLAQT